MNKAGEPKVALVSPRSYTFAAQHNANLNVYKKRNVVDGDHYSRN